MLTWVIQMTRVNMGYPVLTRVIFQPGVQHIYAETTLYSYFYMFLGTLMRFSGDVSTHAHSLPAERRRHALCATRPASSSPVAIALGPEACRFL